MKHHMGRVAKLPCCLCGASPVEVHHIREGQGMAQRADDMLTVPLCFECHRGTNGVHGDKAMMRVLKMDELDMLAKTIRQLLYGRAG